MKKPHLPLDYVLLTVTLILVLIGLIMVTSTSSVVGFSNYSDPYFFVKKHLFYLVIGCVALYFGFRIDHRAYQSVAFNGYVFAVVLLAITLIPGVGIKVGGAQRWLDLGPITFQPVELVKFFLVVFLASSLSNKGEKMKQFSKGFLPVMGLLGLPLVLLALQPDLGNIILISGVSFFILVLSQTRLLYLLFTALSGLTFFLINIALRPYQLDRIKVFLRPWDDPLGKSYHIIQSFIAIGSGGLWGLGLGHSKLKYFYLPLQYSDFIFSVICEELGFIAALAILTLYFLLFYRGVQIGVYHPNPFSSYLAIGLTLMLVLQATLNIGVVIGVFPVTGIPLTFISFGGTSLATSLFFIGVILNISKRTLNETS